MNRTAARRILRAKLKREEFHPLYRRPAKAWRSGDAGLTEDELRARIAYGMEQLAQVSAAEIHSIFSEAERSSNA